ncbi:MAG: 4-hydroxythreonine-4-phosphate dehydrogenase [Campylobacterales bacterium]
MKKIAVSIGDLNGIGFEIALAAHESVKKVACPLYCVSRGMAERAASLLGKKLPGDFECVGEGAVFEIRPGEVDAVAGRASFESFVQAVDWTVKRETDAVVTLPINKAAWMAVGLKYKGHTDYLKERFGEGAIMMLGRPGLYVALFTDHLPLSRVCETVRELPLTEFLLRFATLCGEGPIGVLALNPHAGDQGAIGTEDAVIDRAIRTVNAALKRPLLEGPLVPDTAFTPKMRERYGYYVAMYHDQGLGPLKALAFDESINVTLGLPIVRTSVDHGTAFDIAYRGRSPSVKSYLNAVQVAVKGLWHNRSV